MVTMLPEMRWAIIICATGMLGYERVYRDARGQQRDDRVIITAKRVAWGAAGAIMVTLIDAGNLDYDDTSTRVQTRMQDFVIDRPPHLLGKRLMDFESGETTELGTLRLLEFSTSEGH